MEERNLPVGAPSLIQEQVNSCALYTKPGCSFAMMDLQLIKAGYKALGTESVAENKIYKFYGIV